MIAPSIPWPTQRVAACATAFVLVTLAALGCGEAQPDRVAVHRVSGAITLKGRPMPGAFLTFHPRTPVANVPTPRGSVDRNGAFKLSTYDGGDGAPEGEYLVTVQWYKPVTRGGDVVAGPNVIPGKYAAPATSNISVRVAAGENNLPPIRL
jgi:hypothetical protein